MARLATKVSKYNGQKKTIMLDMWGVVKIEK
jgi:hypothetical protein